MFINAEPILGVLDMYRLIWISGRFGGHKTALSFKIAERYLKAGYNLITNTKSVWADDMDLVNLNENNQLHSVVILDEGGLYFKSSRQVEQIAAYAAKMDVVYIFPSFWPPTKSAQVVNIQPIVSLKATGLPIIIYKWMVNIGGFREKGWFMWVRPSEIYGIYSRQDPGNEPDLIIDWLVEKSEEFRSRYGRKTNNSLSKLVEVTEGDKFLESAEIFETAAEKITALSGRKRSKRR